ncbi:NAD(P)-binding protein [Coemansia reversa NRRL 1564]|uniref:NAD(P)-binding protein n=1 Tax=Coemansia reversa (strain ATCC 12441 / NRRL 1564) TaxID=763665 RepID=A0A2G5B809_COERN|nr:NAD(P)-binding protein [Coemansia reversa NRRL 1564]|eukprot:PIA15130.1 NAD(P)-binding protein [Coemansia reversa NRRL 1564]
MATTYTYKRIAVVGSGGYGWHFLQALTQSNYFEKVRAVTRKPDINDKDKNARINALRELGVEIVTYEDNTVDAFRQAFVDIDTVLSAVALTGVLEQIPMIDGAIQAGVKWFIPSEFGVAHYASAWMPFTSPLASKSTIEHYLVENAHPKGLGYTIVYTGLALDYLDPRSIGLKVKRNAATLVGRGGTPISFTAMVDVIRLMVEIVQRPTEMQNRTIRYAGSTNKLRDLVKIVTHSDRGVNVKIVCIEEAKSKFCELARKLDMQAFSIYCRLLLEEGLGQINRYGEPLDNKLFPDICPESAPLTLRRLMKNSEAELAHIKEHSAQRSATAISVTDGLGQMHLDTNNLSDAEPV